MLSLCPLRMACMGQVIGDDITIFMTLCPLQTILRVQLEPRAAARGRPARPDPGLLPAKLEDPHAGRPHVQPLRRPPQLVTVFHGMLTVGFGLQRSTKMVCKT